ncbi:PTS beta-glucoside transporter subunit EIIBCA [Enterococcus sp. JM4C]|uniref:beta-glucoside-specific PTS transporter subunit IIABC n=1 Tax=Candidatus Enterococcus huntleyi TaxID=1857217 RepID=UPI0013794FD6|nr:beta-glucoside-specific PTS transporter subunit IIABC [Enterococcus sp. JM4C]KAF1297174.1 PTS beta-glucoside transporter subunit EIIBCA [Enterococcus sp. JM4C]
MDYSKTAQDILKEVGGETNVISLAHCMTRLRFVLKNNELVDDRKLETIDGVVGVNRQGEQYQVIIGNDVVDVYKEIDRIAKFDAISEESNEEKKGPVSKVFDFISACMSPLFPALIGAGLIKVLLVLLGPSTFNVVSEASSIYVILSALGDATFYYMPLAVAVTASQRLKVNTFLAIGVVGLLIHPDIVTLLGGEDPTKLFGVIPVVHASYASSLIPALLTVVLLKYVSDGFDKVLPLWTKNFLKPMLAMLVTAFISLVVLAPLGTIVGEWVMTLITSVYDFAPWLAIALLAGGMTFIIMSGMHWAFVPITIMSLSTTGYDALLIPAMMASNLAQGGATLGVGFKTKDKSLKSIAFSSGITATFAGVTEPALYGVTLKLKKPLYAVCGAAAVGGLLAGIVELKAYAFATPSLVAIVQFISPDGGMNFIYACVIGLVSFVGALVGAYILTDKGESKSTSSSNDYTEDKDLLTVYNPVEGEAKELSSVTDEVFASGVMGKGYAVEPSVGLVKAPFSGIVEVFMDSHHALGLISDSGINVLIHVGMDTVELSGKYFTPKVKVGDRITTGQTLLEFDMDKIKKAGYVLTTPVVITNTNEYSEINLSTLGQRTFTDKMIRIEK